MKVLITLLIKSHDPLSNAAGFDKLAWLEKAKASACLRNRAHLHTSTYLLGCTGELLTKSKSTRAGWIDTHVGEIFADRPTHPFLTRSSPVQNHFWGYAPTTRTSCEHPSNEPKSLQALHHGHEAPCTQLPWSGVSQIRSTKNTLKATKAPKARDPNP